MSLSAVNLSQIRFVKYNGRKNSKYPYNTSPMLSTPSWEQKSGTQNVAIILKSYEKLDIDWRFPKM